MTTLREAAQMALEALGCIESPMYVREINEVGKAMGALRAALEQPEPEPVAWHYTSIAGVSVVHWGPSPSLDADLAMAKQYPHAHKVTPLYAAPPQREPLTDEQIKRILTSNGFKTYPELGDDLKPYCYAAIRAIERAHRIGVNDGE